MSSLDFELDLDARVSRLELEWRLAFEANIVARSNYHTIAARPDADLEALDQARESLERSEAAKSHVLNKIDRLERRVLARR